MKRIFVLLQYVGFLATLFNLDNTMYSQVIYTDIPDATPSVTYPLDINNDTVDDFLLQFQSINQVMCIPLNNNAYAGGYDGIYYLPWALSASSSICDSLVTWYDASNPGTMAIGTSIGNWVGGMDKYLGLKLIVGTDTFFGWVRLDFLTGSTSFTVKDYAYESTPGACIIAGQINLSVNLNKINNDISIYPNPFSSFTTVETFGNFSNMELMVLDSFGRKLYRISEVSNNKFSLALDDLPSGIYFIKIIKNSSVIAYDKFIISK